ncbi:MAG: hypothetical protein IKD76_05640 [Clostridia bacterium]|nr:hypothetical protein [Clostridia bacterium]
MKEEVTLVTEFFDIGRKDFNLNPRSNEKYLEYFKFWARIKNKLIVYTYKAMADEVRKIREEFGLLDRTIVIEIDDETKLEPEIYKNIEKIAENNYIKDYRYYYQAVENNAKYNYVMLLKYWCLADAVKKKYADGMVAWIDFGFNHGNDCYINSEEFDFLWETELSMDKIHLFALDTKLTEEPVFELVRNMDVDIMGDCILAPANFCEKFWESVKVQMESLVRVGFIDDDQILLLMSYREIPEIYEMHKSDWFMPLKENGGSHLTVKEKVQSKPSLKNRILEYLRNKKRYLMYLKREKKYFRT